VELFRILLLRITKLVNLFSTDFVTILANCLISISRVQFHPVMSMSCLKFVRKQTVSLRSSILWKIKPSNSIPWMILPWPSKRNTLNFCRSGNQTNLFCLHSWWAKNATCSENPTIRLQILWHLLTMNWTEWWLPVVGGLPLCFSWRNFKQRAAASPTLNLYLVRPRTCVKLKKTENWMSTNIWSSRTMVTRLGLQWPM